VDAEVTAADSNIALKIKMADVRPETLEPDIANGIFMKFNGIRIFASNNLVEQMLVQEDVRVSEQSKMATGK